MSILQPPNALNGLSQAEAEARLQIDGPNALPRPERRSPAKIVIEVLREPMLVLLLVGGAIYLVLGDIKDAAVLIAFAMVSVVITVVQELRTERVLEALRDLTSPKAVVIRDGTRTTIPGRDLVRGDLVVLSEGERAPADGRLIQGHDIQADESMLTGESVPVRKQAGAQDGGAPASKPGGNVSPTVFSGSLIVRGTGIMEVTATGAGSAIGQIGQSLNQLSVEPPRLRLQTQKLVAVCGAVGGTVSVLAVLLYGLLRGSWLQALLSGITIGMSMLPEEFPVVMTVFMAMGAWRISQARVLTRRGAAIETLGSATVLCTDKTGTLTMNQMTIAELRLPSGGILDCRLAVADTMTDDYAMLLATGRLASTPGASDPMEKAFFAFGGDRQASLNLVHSYGLRPDLLAMTQVWQAPGDGPAIVAAKGAPEAIALLCRLDGAAAGALKTATEAMAGEGLRVLGIAAATHAGDWPQVQTAFDFRFLGLVGLADPLRPGAASAVHDCRAAGIRVVMITGDYPATARAIARDAGLDADTVVTGDEMDTLDPETLADRVRSANVFARIMPKQKLRIIEALKANGDVVAMTGDGVNDAPSLKAAHIGIAMGKRGTDVAREAASLVLLDDDFTAIAAAIRLGRRIYDNLQKATGFILAVHLPIAGLALMPLLFGMPIIFGPMHIAFLEMIIDPVCALVFEAEDEEDDIMTRPPRAPDAPLFPWRLIGWSLLQGTLVLVLIGALYAFGLHAGISESEARAMAFVALVLSVVSLILVNRSLGTTLLKTVLRPNTALVYVLAFVVAFLGLALFLPLGRDLFHFGVLGARDIGLAVSVAAPVLLLHFIKPIAGRRKQ